MKPKAWLLLALLICLSAWAQEKKQPLKTILEQISRQHQVTFNYVEDEIVLYKLVPPAADLTLPAKLNYIKSLTSLRFVPAGGSGYVVSNDKKLDKPLCGFLRDQDTRLPIEAASLFITGTNVSAVSDGKGYFELPVLSPNTIEIRHQNYEPFFIEPTSLYKPDCPEILLIPIVNTLDEVVAERFLTTGISKNSDGSFKITPRNFGILPGLSEPDVLQAMQELPGIENEDETISNISVRGGTHDQNLFLWNGIRMFQTGHFFGLISAFNPVLPQTISISINGTPALFGESVSSVIDISSHSPKISESRHVAGIDLISGYFYTNTKVSPKASFAISGRRSFGDLFISPTYKNYRERIFQNTIVTNQQGQVQVVSDEHFYFCDFTVQYRQKIGQRHELSVDGIGIVNSLIIDQVSESVEKNNDLAQKSFGAVVDWSAHWNDRHDTRINAYVSNYKLTTSTEEINTSSLTLEQQNEVLDIGLRMSHLWRVSDKLEFTGGYQFDETGVTNLDEINSPAFSRNITEILHTHVAVADALFKTADKKMQLRTGLRMNYLEKFRKLLPEYRIQFGRQLSEAFHLEILGEQKSQTLSQVIDRQMDFLGIEKRRWAMANNSDVPIQNGSQVSVGVTFKKNNWLVTFDNFYKEVYGITTATQGFQNQLEFVRSTGSYRVLGSEILVQKNFGRFYSWLSYGFNDNRYRFEELSPSYFPNNFELRHTLAAAAIYEWKKLKIALGSKWHSGRPVTTPASDVVGTGSTGSPQIFYNDPNNERLPDFTVLNFSASKEWEIGRKISFQASLSVINILNTDNIVNRFYRVNPDGVTIDRIDTHALARTPNVNLRLVF